MSSPTFESFNYGLRPAKNVERKMICEAMARLSRIASLRSYSYVGFGAIGFHDFILVHQRLGIRDMTSVEGYIEAQDRVEFNKPYSCIRMKWGLSYEVLTQLKWKKRIILWLDYDKPITGQMLGDIRTAVTSMRSGSALIVTVAADPGPIENAADAATKRLQDLRSRVGVGKIRGDVKGADLAKWGLARVSRDIINDHVERTLNERNGPLPASSQLKYQQLFNFHYSDGCKMLTVGGLLCDNKDFKKLNKRHFSDLDFIRSEESESAYHIQTPILTLREIRYLDERLPRLVESSKMPSWIPEDDCQRYSKIYRYYPNFSEVET